jgi:hypothetical protein
MGEVIISASGTQFGLIVNADGSLNVQTDSQLPTEGDNPAWGFTYQASGTVTGMTGSSIGSIFQYIGTMTYTQKLTWQSGLIIKIGSWV